MVLQICFLSVFFTVKLFIICHALPSSAFVRCTGELTCSLLKLLLQVRNGACVSQVSVVGCWPTMVENELMKSKQDATIISNHGHCPLTLILMLDHRSCCHGSHITVYDSAQSRVLGGDEREPVLFGSGGQEGQDFFLFASVLCGHWLTIRRYNIVTLGSYPLVNS